MSRFIVEDPFLFVEKLTVKVGVVEKLYIAMLRRNPFVFDEKLPFAVFIVEIYTQGGPCAPPAPTNRPASTRWKSRWMIRVFTRTVAPLAR
ncbi:hypothetical protein [Pontiella sulfatireligans]|uniref:hypothetical protein n=1 Tax=Pontiella sulfatireligans TaxID=2750658 RepID=UPI00109C7A28|nr:hypothetical protein [Pontiella sulfatireligans]